MLSDGAARAPPHLGIGTPADVRALLVYAPFIGFTTDGADHPYGLASYTYLAAPP